MNLVVSLRRAAARIAVLALMTVILVGFCANVAQAQSFNISSDCGELTPMTGALAPLAPVLGDPTTAVCTAIRNMNWVDRGKQIAQGLLLGLLAIEFTFIGIQHGLFREDPGELLGSVAFRVLIVTVLSGIISNSDLIFSSIIRSNYDPSAGSFRGGFEGVAYQLSHTSRNDVGNVISIYTGTAALLAIFAGSAHLADVTDPALAGNSGVAAGNGFFLTGSALSFGSLHALDIQVVYMLCGLLLLAAMIIYLQYVLLTIESLIVIFGGIVFIGFAGWSQTAQFARGYMQYAISNGVKLLVFYLVLSILKSILPAVVGLSLTSAAAIAYARGPFIGFADAATFTLAIAFFQALVGALLTWFIPNFAGSFITGNPAVGISDAVGGLQSTVKGMSGIVSQMRSTIDAATQKKLEANKGALEGSLKSSAAVSQQHLDVPANANRTSPTSISAAHAAGAETAQPQATPIAPTEIQRNSGFVSGRGNGAVGFSAYTMPMSSPGAPKHELTTGGHAGAPAGSNDSGGTTPGSQARMTRHQHATVTHVYRTVPTSLGGADAGADDGGEAGGGAGEESGSPGTGASPALGSSGGDASTGSAASAAAVAAGAAGPGPAGGTLGGSSGAAPVAAVAAPASALASAASSPVAGTSGGGGGGLLPAGSSSVPRSAASSAQEPAASDRASFAAPSAPSSFGQTPDGGADAIAQPAPSTEAAPPSNAPADLRAEYAAALAAATAPSAFSPSDRPTQDRTNFAASDVPSASANAGSGGFGEAPSAQPPAPSGGPSQEIPGLPAPAVPTAFSDSGASASGGAPAPSPSFTTPSSPAQPISIDVPATPTAQSYASPDRPQNVNDLQATAAASSFAAQPSSGQAMSTDARVTSAASTASSERPTHYASEPPMSAAPTPFETAGSSASIDAPAPSVPFAPNQSTPPSSFAPPSSSGQPLSMDARATPATQAYASSERPTQYVSDPPVAAAPAPFANAGSSARADAVAQASAPSAVGQPMAMQNSAPPPASPEAAPIERPVSGHDSASPPLKTAPTSFDALASIRSRIGSGFSAARSLTRFGSASREDRSTTDRGEESE